MRPEKNITVADLPSPAVLLVEDDETDILLLRRAFRNASIGNPVMEVRDGQEAIHYLSGDGAYADRVRYPMPFLVLMDLRLPKLSGFEVLAWIRDQSQLADLKVVVLTASDYVRDVNQAHDLGANCYLVKPPTFEELVEVVRGIKGRWLVLDELPKDATPEQASHA